MLAQWGFKVGSIHGNKSQNQRDRTLTEFRNGELDVLVATDVAARGIDIPGVRHVYNYDLPNVPENYVHRIGRTARAGAEGNAVAFCAPAEMGELQAIEKVLKKQIPVIGGAPWAADIVAAAPKPGQNRGQGRGQNRGQSQGQRPGKPGGAKPQSRPEHASQAPKPQPRTGAKPARPMGGGQSPTRPGGTGKPRRQGNRRPG